MFTGLVEDLGVVVAVDRTAAGAALTVESRLARELGEGDSIAVNGVCLTATGICGDRFGADVMHETLRRSSLGDVDAGAKVNLELALRADARLGGHIMQGHVDGTATVVERTEHTQWTTLRFRVGDDLTRYIVEKGSIAVDGVSLTVTEVDDDSFAVGLIPTTLRETTLGERIVGSTVNLEVDVVAKYVERLVGFQAGTSQGK
jgi:riboflavin synthase